MMTKLPSDRGYIYAAQWGDYVKLGFTTYNPTRRIAAIHEPGTNAIPYGWRPRDVVNPTPERRVFILGAFRGIRYQEKQIHAALRPDFKRHAEWYLMTQQFERFIKRLPLHSIAALGFSPCETWYVSSSYMYCKLV